MTAIKRVDLWTSKEHARDYLERADSISHHGEGESALLEFIPAGARRILDLGTGDGRRLSIVRRAHPNSEAVAVDFSPTMLEAARQRFAGEAPADRGPSTAWADSRPRIGPLRSG
jgi:tRNA (cmo5U34)-methyltransferase